MTDNEIRERPKRRLFVFVVAAAILVLLFATMAYFTWPTNSSDRPDQQKPPATTTTTTDPSSQGSADVTDPAPPAPIGGKIVLPEAMSGQAAIDALGTNIERVAQQNSLTVEAFEELLLRDASAHVSRTGRLVYLDSGLKQAP